MAQRKQTQIPSKLKDFRAFLTMVWRNLGLPDPTPVQLDIAWHLQYGENRQIIQAFRGEGKSYITSAYAVWQLMWDPDKKIMVVSASGDRAKDFTHFTFRIIHETPLLSFLVPGTNQRSSMTSFDVGPAKSDHSPSVKSVGITGQLTGSRADLIIADDVEVPSNSRTEIMREQLRELVKEFDSILKPGGSVVFLGTPQTEMSVYNVLVERGYTTRIWPARFPSEDRVKRYKGELGPYIRRCLDNDPTLPDQCGGRGHPTDDYRFTDLDLWERETSYGRSGFALQFMLDTALSDVEKFPLKTQDLIVMGLDKAKGPVSLAWGSSPALVENDLANQGLSGDRFHRPMWTSDEYANWGGTVLAIDPSGRGKDETAYAVLHQLHGNLFLADSGGYMDGYSEATLETLASIALRWDVGHIQIESNYGDGMFMQLLRPYLEKKGVVASLDEIRVTTAKEWRIADTLEPVMVQHRLVVDRGVVQQDFEDTKDDPRYSLFYQMTRLTRDKGALVHDDRLDALYIAVAYWVEAMKQDQYEEADRVKQEALNEELEKFIDGAKTRHGRYRGRNGRLGRTKDAWVIPR